MVHRHSVVPRFLLTLLGISALMLGGCGESDLQELQLQEIEAARQELDLGPAVGDQTDVDILLEGSSLVFSDDFDADGIDTSLWNTAMPWGASQSINEEQQYYVDLPETATLGHTPFVHRDGTLVIRAEVTPEEQLSNVNQQPYLSGVITTQGKFSFTYGYAEVRAKLPTGKGLWPGFWMLGQDFIDRKPQLFVMEGRGDNTGLVYHRYNFNDDNDVYQYSDLLKSTVDDFSSEFHSYGVKWQPGVLTFYVDGRQTYTIENDGVSAQDMYLILNLAVGGWFPGDADGTTIFPAEFVVDYVRVFELSGS